MPPPVKAAGSSQVNAQMRRYVESSFEKMSIHDLLSQAGGYDEEHTPSSERRPKKKDKKKDRDHDRESLKDREWRELKVSRENERAYMQCV